VLGFLGMISDPTDTVAAFLYRISAIADLGDRLDALEPVRMLLSEGTLVFLASVCLTLILLIALLAGLRTSPTLIPCSAGVSAAGAVMMFAPVLMNDWKNYMLVSLRLPEATFNIVYLPLIESMRTVGARIALAGLTVMIFSLVIGVFASMIRREKELAEKYRSERVIPHDGTGF